MGGRIPLSWLGRACALPGRKTLAVALAICFERGLRKRPTFEPSAAALGLFDMDRKAKHRALAALEKAGLVHVERWPRQLPTVTVLGWPEPVVGEYVAGPIPLSWMGRACELPGRTTLATALALWFETRRRKSLTFMLTSAVVRRFHVSPDGQRRALARLSEVGLVAVRSRGKKNPEVTILDVGEEVAARAA